MKQAERGVLFLLGLLGCWLTTACVACALAPRTPGRRLSYYAILLAARAPVVAAVAAVSTLAVARNAHRSPVRDISAIVGGLSATVALVLTAAQWRVARRHHLGLDLRGVLMPARRAEAPRAVAFARRADSQLLADLYQVSGRTKPAPAVVVIHGGAWRYGDKSENPAFNRWLAARGYVVFDVQYRLARDGNWQHALEDIRSGITWLRRHADELGIDAGRISLVGRSAGGHLALLCAYTQPGQGIRSVIALYADTDLALAYAEARGRRTGEVRAGLEALLGGTPATHGDVYREASPIAHVRTSVPATLLIHGSWDRAVDVNHSRKLAAQLEAANACVELVQVPFARHAFDIVPYGVASELTRRAVLRFLDARA